MGKKKEKNKTKESKTGAKDRLDNLVIPTALLAQADEDVPHYATASDMTDEEKKAAIRKNLVGNDKTEKETEETKNTTRDS